MLLDDSNPKPTTSGKYSKASFGLALLSLILISYLYNQIPTHIKASEGLPEPPINVVRGIYLFIIAGIATSVLSFTHKEPSGWIKWIGVGLNSLLCLGLLGSILFA